MPYTDHTNPNTINEFDKVSGGYDTRFDNCFDHAEEEHIYNRFGYLLRLADVLDIGCGTALIKDLADRDLFRPTSYVGIDAAQGMINKAQQKHPESRFFMGDMIEIMDQMEPQSFDTVVSMYFPLNYTTHHHAKVYAAVRRVLRPRGYFVNVAASSRYAARQSHIVSANNMRRYFDDSPYHMGMMSEQFSVAGIFGTNYVIERYRRWLEHCPKSINKMLFYMDSDRFKQSGKKPLIYTFILQKL